MADVERLTADTPDQQARLPALKDHIGGKRRELAETVALRRTQGFEAARAVVASDRGKAAMDAIRADVETMEQEEQRLRNRRLAETDDAFRVAVGGGLLGVLLPGAVASLVRRAAVARRRQEWLQSGQLGLSKAMGGNQRLEQLGDRVLKFLAEYLDAHAGAFFAKDGGGYRRVAAYGVPAVGGAPDVV